MYVNFVSFHGYIDIVVMEVIILMGKFHFIGVIMLFMIKTFLWQS